MKRWIALLALAVAPVALADKLGGYLDKAGKGIERGAKATGKAAERPRAATQKFLEKSGIRINKATGGK